MSRFQCAINGCKQCGITDAAKNSRYYAQEHCFSGMLQKEGNNFHWNLFSFSTEKVLDCFVMLTALEQASGCLLSAAHISENWPQQIFYCQCRFLYEMKKSLVEYELEFSTGTRFHMQSKTALIKIGTRTDLPEPGKVKEFLARGRFVCVANVNGEICAMDNVCPHWGGPLGQGTIENGKIVCPWHGWQYDPKTGKTPRKADVRLTIFKLEIEGDDVFVEL